jgi:hypothetical protein
MASLKFDVVSVVGKVGVIKEVIARNLTMQEALKIQAAKNECLRTAVAVVLPSGGYEPPDCDSDASSEPDDLEAMREEVRALDAKYDLRDYIVRERAAYVRQAMDRHLKQIERSLCFVYDAGDIGIVCRSIEMLAEILDFSDDRTDSAFEDGMAGEWHNDELEEMLGITAMEAAAAAASREQCAG